MRFLNLSILFAGSVLLASCGSDSDDAHQQTSQQADTGVQVQARVIEGEEVEGLLLQSVNSSSSAARLRLPEIFGEPVYEIGLSGLEIPQFPPDNIVDTLLIDSEAQYRQILSKLGQEQSEVPDPPAVDFRTSVVLAHTDNCPEFGSRPHPARLEISEEGTKLTRLAFPSYSALMSLAFDDVIPAEDPVEHICKALKGGSVNFYKLPRSVVAPFSVETRSWAEAKSLNLGFDIEPFMVRLSDVYEASPKAQVLKPEEIESRIIEIRLNIETRNIFFEAMRAGLTVRGSTESGYSSPIGFDDPIKFQQFWQLLQSRNPEVGDPPAIDFAQERLVAYSRSNTKLLAIDGENLVILDLFLNASSAPIGLPISSLTSSFVRVPAGANKLKYVRLHSDYEGRWLCDFDLKDIEKDRGKPDFSREGLCLAEQGRSR